MSYTGQPYDAETGLFYFRNRYYDGRTGRFTQEDPIGFAGGLNLYAYAYNNPVSYTDPFGLCPPEKTGRPCGVFEPGHDALESPGLLDPVAWLVGGVAGGLKSLAGRAAAKLEGTALARVLGKAGEAAAGLAKNTTRIPSATGTAAYRVPDALSPTTLSEVKNVSKLSLTNQLRDYMIYAEQQGLRFDLYVRRDTELSAPLVDAISRGLINLRYLP